MDTQFHIERYGGRIMRPAVIPRNHNPSIAMQHFSLQCGGKVGTKVLEDEMYMSDIIMMAEDLAITWYRFPLDQVRAPHTHTPQLVIIVVSVPDISLSTLQVIVVSVPDICLSTLQVIVVSVPDISLSTLQVPTLSINWEYGVCYPVSRFFDIDPDQNKGLGDEDDDDDDEYVLLYKAFLGRMKPYCEGVVYLNPDRRSMMLFLSTGRFGEGEAECMQNIRVGNDLFVRADGGPEWSPQVELVHEFTLLPNLEPFDAHLEGQGDNNQNIELLWGGVTLGCSSVQDMQNRLFKLGFGPMPYFRRAGVLLLISPDELYDDDTGQQRLGCVVSHCYGLRGCCRNNPDGLFGGDENEDGGADTANPTNRRRKQLTTMEEDRCYFCREHPFYEVLFHNPKSAYALQDDNDDDESEDADAMLHNNREREGWQTVPISPNRAFHRAVPVGTRLLMTLDSLSSILKAFDPMTQSHVVKKMQAQMAEQQRIDRLRMREVVDKENSATKRRKTTTSDHPQSSFRRTPLQPMNHTTQRTRKMSMLMSAEYAGQSWAGSMEKNSRTRRELERLVRDSMVRCYLNVSSVLSCRDGFVCVAISCASAEAKNAGKDVKNFYVAPQHLLLPEDDRQWEAAVSHIVI